MNKGIRRQGRELALKALYGLAADAAADPERFLAEFWAHFRFQDDVLGEALEDGGGPVPDAVREFADDRIRGTVGNLERIDGVLGEFSTNWSLERMARVDLALLRLGTYELLLCPDVPASVAINEAIELGKQYGTRETPAFVNGILDRVARTHRRDPQ